MSYLIFDDIENGKSFNQGQASTRNCDGVLTVYWFAEFIDEIDNKLALDVGNDFQGGRLGPGVNLVQTLEGNFNLSQ